MEITFLVLMGNGVETRRILRTEWGVKSWAKSTGISPAKEINSFEFHGREQKEDVLTTPKIQDAII